MKSHGRWPKVIGQFSPVILGHFTPAFTNYEGMHSAYYATICFMIEIIYL